MSPALGGEAKCDELGADNCKGYTLIAPGMFASCGVVGPNCLTTGPMCKEVVRWFLGSNGQTCNGICKAKGFTACNKEKMASLDTAEKMDTAAKAAGYTCKLVSGHRSYAGTPFSTGRADDCYYWSPGVAASSVNCDANEYGGHRPLCYCD
mmetsp:Transcript_90655/g.216457  ORF Transcript_90655/g.216457 Transcript_90655/m.216457 type:complete len:151 (+) Transcript_90655:222-674(+)